MTTPNASDLILIDSSGWLEWVTDDTKAADFAPHFERERFVIVPTIVIYEVYKKLLGGGGKFAADRFLSDALRRQVVSLDENLAVAAAAVGTEHRLAMADAIIYATARSSNAQLITSDPHFSGLPGVTLI